MTYGTRKAYQWFRGQGVRAQAALTLARGEDLLDLAEEAGIARLEWQDEDDRYEDTIGFESERERERWYCDAIAGRITGPYWAALYVNDNVEASVGMVTLGPGDISGDPYAREIRAELGCEAQDAIRRALTQKEEHMTQHIVYVTLVPPPGIGPGDATAERHRLSELADAREGVSNTGGGTMLVEPVVTDMDFEVDSAENVVLLLEGLKSVMADGWTISRLTVEPEDEP